MNVHKIFYIGLLLIFIFSCKEVLVFNELQNEFDPPFGTSYLAPEIQRQGDAEKGRDYLINGNYLSSGIPYAVFNNFFEANDANVLNREGDNASLPPNFTAVNHENGERIVVANCLSCHGSSLNGTYYLGLGNRNSDFTASQGSLINLLDLVIGNDALGFEAYSNFRRGTLAVADQIITETVGGVNPADHLFGVLAAHRDKNSLEWLPNDSVSFSIPSDITYVTDIPPWWHFKKKNAKLANGMGQGDFTKLFMAASTLTLTDAAEAKIIDEKMVDVMAFLKTIEAPAYPFEIDATKIEEGKNIFENNCSACHGTYGNDAFYPNLLVDISVIKTDPALIEQSFLMNSFIDWFNTGWFGSNEPAGKLNHNNGYMAPPLDGIWASAPYLHNGSIPNLYEVLNSAARKNYWRKTPSTEEYDPLQVGWKYTEELSKIDKFTYDTSSKGYSNKGHYFGDALNDAERFALIEYLKTL